MTNPDDAIGTNGAYDGRTSVNAFNDIMSAFTRGVVSGWGCLPSSGMKVAVGGDGENRDVAIAEDANGNKTSINNIGATPIEVTIGSAPATNIRIDSIVAYVDNPPQGLPTVTDNPGACGIIVVPGTASSTPVAPNDSAIRSAITTDGASGLTAYYVVLANVTVASGTTDITSGEIEQGPRACLVGEGVVGSNNIDFATITKNTFPFINVHTNNNNVNSDTFYTQYTYTIPESGLYLMWFSQRLGTGAQSGYDFTVKITKNNVDINYAKSGGNNYISFIEASILVLALCNKGDTIRCQSSGGGPGVIPTLDGAFVACKLV